MDGQLGINPLENNHLLQQIPNFRIDQFKSTKKNSGNSFHSLLRIKVKA